MGGKLMKKNDLKKHTQKRKFENVCMPIQSILKIEDIFDDRNDLNKPNLIKLKNHLKGEGRLSIELSLKIIEMADCILKTEPNVLRINYPVNIVGDIHGQFYDLLTIFTLGGSPGQFKYLFMGDFVDRGLFSFECVSFLYCLKIRYPNEIFLIRGNHESRHLTKYFTFRDECLLKSNELVYEKFMDSFDSLPISAIVDSKFFCVHGGLSPNLNLIEDLEKEYRFKEIPKHGLLCDLTWSDPVDNFSIKSKNSNSSLNQSSLTSLNSNKNQSSSNVSDFYVYNSSRGCSFNFTPLAVERFLRDNNLISIIRAHQVQREGIKFTRCLLTKKNSNISIGFPSLISLFSAPNYCDVYNNKAAIIQYTGKRFIVKLFNASEHPFVLPNFQNAFTWSMPFIYEKISEILLFFLNQLTDDEESINNQENKSTQSSAKLDKKDTNNFNKNNQLPESGLKLGTLTPTNKLRRRSSDADRDHLIDLESKGINSFEDANNLDTYQYKIINSDNEVDVDVSEQKNKAQ